MPPIYDDCDKNKVVVYDNCYDDTYAIKNDDNPPHETCDIYKCSPTEHYDSNIQLFYCVQVLYDSPTPTISNRKDFAYVESNNSFMHVDHDKNALCDSYIVEFIHDATESYYERGK